MQNSLDLNNGKSVQVSMNHLEKITGLRQVSNGGKIIRDDAMPFDKFQIERHYDPETLSLTSVTFNGYRTVGYQRGVVSSRIKRRKEKVEALQKLIQDDVGELLNLYGMLETTSPDTPLFDKTDVSVIFTG